MTTNRKLLIVDDDANLRESFQRQFRKHFLADTAGSGEEGLKTLELGGPYALVISDYRMPGMTGIEFLAKVKEASPDTVRILLTGYAELDVAIRAVNEGSIFRLLTKPCPPEMLAQAIQDGLRQWSLITAERELLENTLRGSVQVLSEVLALVKPEVYGRLSRITPLVRSLSAKMGDPEPWQTETAAMLCLVGYIILPEQVVRRVTKGKPLSSEEYQAFSRHPAVAAQLISHIPRMDKVAHIISYQEKHYDGSGIPADGVKGEDIPLGARILKAALDLDHMTESGERLKSDALGAMRAYGGWYDPGVMEALEDVVAAEASHQAKKVFLNGLKERMVLEETIYMVRNGKVVKLLGKGAELTAMSIEYLRRLGEHVKINEPIRVLEPVQPKE